jgi:hypothetical protein
MADYLTNLTTARDNIVAALVAMTANPKPNYIIDGQSVSWGALFNNYQNALQNLNNQIVAANPYEFTSEGVT